MNINIQKKNINFTGWAPLKNKKAINDVVKLIKSDTVQKVAISGHKMPDADCICSSIALANIINKATGKKVDVFVFDDIPQKYSRFNCNKNITLIPILSTKIFNKENLLKEFGIYDLAISVDTAVTNLMWFL